MTKVICYVIEEVEGVLIKRVEDTVEKKDIFLASLYADQYNRNSSEFNTSTFLRIADVQHD